MVPIRIMGTHSVVKWKSEIILWRANYVCLPSDFDALYQNLEHIYWCLPLWGHLVLKPYHLLGGQQEWSISAYFLHCFIKISVSASGLNPLPISANVQKADGNVHKKNVLDGTSSVVWDGQSQATWTQGISTFQRSSYTEAWITRKLHFKIISFLFWLW